MATQQRKPTSKVMRFVYAVVFIEIIVICCAPRNAPLQCLARVNKEETDKLKSPEATPKVKKAKKKRNAEEKCYCQLSGKTIHDTNCLCNIDELIEYNENSIYPLMEQLVLTDFFRFYKVNLDNGCKFWNEDYLCTTNKCGISPCTPEELPSELRAQVQNLEKTLEPCPLSQVVSLASNEFQAPAKAPDSSNQAIITQLSNEEYSSMTQHWDKFDRESSDNVALPDSTPVYERDFCPDDDQFDVGAKYYDLLKNPEGYTGYKGEASHKIWRKIYDENCYEPKKSKKVGLPSFMKEENSLNEKESGVFGGDPKKVLDEFTCVEKRVFYRAVSGIHSSISVHIAKQWYDVDADVFMPNSSIFEERFEHKRGQEYIHNLYFVWLLELRAIHKAVPYIVRPDLIQALFRTGDVHSDIRTQSQVLNLSEVVGEFPMHFDESNLFQGNNADEMMEEFRQRIMQIQTIIDCADCEKCRLWGKLQTHALATAVRILLTPVECIDVESFSRDDEVLKCPEFKLSRREIVALFNGFARLTASVHYVEEFKAELQARKSAKNAKKNKPREEL